MIGLLSVNKVAKGLRYCSLCLLCNDKRMEDMSTCKRIKISMTDAEKKERKKALARGRYQQKIRMKRLDELLGSIDRADRKLCATSVEIHVALWELPNTSENIMSKTADHSPVAKERGPMTDSVKIYGTKRQQPDSPSSHQPHVTKGVNGHLVYVRRKHETERGKKSTSINADSLSPSILSRKPENEVIKEPKPQQERTQECNEISHSHEKATDGVEPMDLGITAIADAPVDPERPNNLDCKVDPQTSSNLDSNASVDPQRSRCQEDKTPVDPQRPINQDLNAPVDPQRTSNQDTKAPVDPQRLSNQDLNAPVDPQRQSNQDAKAPVDPQSPRSQDCKSPLDLQRLRNQDRKAPVDPQRLRNQDSEAPVDTRRPNNQNPKAPVDTRRPNNQDSKEPVDPHGPSTQDWKERYLQLQVFLKNCDQSSQEGYKTMLRSLTAAGRSRHALELEKRALNLFLEEGKELHHMQVLNIIGEAPLQDRASPSIQNSAAHSLSSKEWKQCITPSHHCFVKLCTGQ